MSTLPPPPPAPTDAPPPAGTYHRSGAVARMLRMPVATLRVWERRYGLSQPALSPSGQRLYSADDVRRLALIKQLTDLGHAIGRLAPLDMAQLQQVASTHARALAGRQAESAPAADAPFSPLRPIRPPLVPAAGAPLSVAVIGPALVARLERPSLRRRLDPAIGPVRSRDRLEDLTQPGDPILLIHMPNLQADSLASLRDQLAARPTGVRVGVIYRYAADAACESLADAGVALLREPQPDAVLAQWLNALGARAAPAAPRPDAAPEPIPPRRWDDAALADFAGLSSTIACECPRHVAELLVQLSHFEAYSADCAHRSPADADLHDHLRQITARARASFETALETLARHEGLLLPRQTAIDVSDASD